jgi:hypothetical protein
MGRLVLAACCCGALALSSELRAALVANDSAADSAYNDGLQPGDNGGTGWGGGWTFRDQNNNVLTSGDSHRGWFTGTSLANNDSGDTNSDGDINSPGVNRAWALYSNQNDGSNVQVYAVRPFTGTLSVGQTVMWDMDNGNIDFAQVVGMRLLTNASDIASRVFELRFVGGDANYSIIADPNATTSTGYTREGLHLEYTLTGPTSFSLKIVRLQSNTTQIINGVNSAAGNIAALAFKNQLAGTNDPSNAYFNNILITVVPELSAGLLCGSVGAVGAVVAWGARLKKRRRDRAA